ncbi:hypothetical protein, partial [Helicobacter canis]|uniref:hypothetical protein n=1 Tax=Helicobacter canis TaxID=29419 RepID=UPI0026EBAF9D
AGSRGNPKNAIYEKVDSSDKAQNVSEPQAAGFLMRNLCFASVRKGAYLAYVTAAHATQSKIYHKKPTPKPLKVDSRFATLSIITH